MILILFQKGYLNLVLKIFVSIIESTAQKSDLQTNIQLISIQELTRLCLKSPNNEKAIYPYLSKFILTTSGKKTDLKLQYTKAYCIDRIIKYRYD